MTLERKLLLLALVPLGFALIPASLLLMRAQTTTAEMERLDRLAALVWKMSEIERSLDLEHMEWWQFGPGHESDAPDVVAKHHETEDGLRSKTDLAFTAYDEALAKIDAGTLSPRIRENLAQVASTRSRLSALRELMYHNQKEENNAILADGYMAIRTALSGALPLLASETSNASIARKLLVLSKATVARKDGLSAGGYIYWTIQTYAGTKALTPRNVSQVITQFSTASETSLAEIPAMSDAEVREKFLALYQKPEWREGIELTKKFAECILNQTTPPPLVDEAKYKPYWALIEIELGDFLSWSRDDFTRTCDEVRQAAVRQRNINAGLIVVCLIGLSLTARRFARGIAAPLRATASQLAEGAATFAEEAEKMAIASSSLSDGACRQAASLEETGASLEELSAVTKANAQTASLAVEASHAASKTALEGKQFISTLSVTVAAVEKSGSAISGILKTIDAIAFQTNILALNAAVEAARAGEAGAGFAVVAEEVRTLAQRSAHAAKETAVLLAGGGDSAAGSSRGVVEGLGKIRADAARVAAQFEDIVAKIAITDGHAGQIATASNEQASGLNSVTEAVHDIDAVTQGNASSSRNVADTADLLKTKAEEMKRAATMLQDLIGVKTGRGAELKRPRAVALSSPPPVEKPAAHPQRLAHGRYK